MNKQEFLDELLSNYNSKRIGQGQPAAAALSRQIELLVDMLFDHDVIKESPAESRPAAGQHLLDITPLENLKKVYPRGFWQIISPHKTEHPDVWTVTFYVGVETEDDTFSGTGSTFPAALQSLATNIATRRV